MNLKGMQIALEKRPTADSFLKLSIFLHERFILRIEACLVWHKTIMKEDCYGLYFSKIKHSDRERVYRFMCDCYMRMLIERWWRGLSKKKGGEEMQDHRIFERVPVKFPLRYLGPMSGQEAQGQTHDISAKGIGVLTGVDLSKKTSLELWIEIPDKGEPFYTRGEVAWSQRVSPDKFRIGIDLDKADLMGMSRLLRT